jgi:thiosulfate reductase cytochrome b subunit
MSCPPPTLAVIFLFFPLIIITGFAMSPAITSVVSQFVNPFAAPRFACASRANSATRA